MVQSTRPKGEVVQSVSDYKVSEPSIDMNQIHHKDLMKLHQQTVNMIHWDLDLQHATTRKLYNILGKIATQYGLEKVVTQETNIKIKVLEKALLELSEDPWNVKHTQKLLKDMDKELNLLKQKVSIPGPHTVTIEEVDIVEREKEDIARQLIIVEDKIHGYITKV